MFLRGAVVTFLTTGNFLKACDANTDSIMNFVFGKLVSPNHWRHFFDSKFQNFPIGFNGKFCKFAVKKVPP